MIGFLSSLPSEGIFSFNFNDEITLFDFLLYFLKGKAFSSVFSDKQEKVISFLLFSAFKSDLHRSKSEIKPILSLYLSLTISLIISVISVE
jgi:hypothetical protein